MVTDICFRIAASRTAIPLAAITFLMLALPADLPAQVKLPDCGGEGERACTIYEAEFWANNRDCDYGLKNTTDHVSFFFGKGGTCVNDTRRTVAKDSSWAAWALHQQRDGIQGDLPLNQVTTLGTHNSFSNYRDGNTNALSTNQYYSITDQLQLGARFIRVDPIFFYDQMRVCHASPIDLNDLGRYPEKTMCEALGVMSTLGLAEIFLPIAAVSHLLPIPLPLMVDGVLVASAGYTSAQHISGRLFSYSIKEIAKWLDDNPEEVIILKLHEGEGQSDRNELVKGAIEKYLGGRVFTPSERDSNGKQWPTLNQLKSWSKTHSGQLNKQVIITSDKGSAGELAFSRFDSLYKDFDPETCALTDKNIGMQTYDWLASQADGWLGIGEGRTGSDATEAGLKKAVNEQEVTKAVNCGVSRIELDFLMSLNRAYSGFNRADPDRRREAAIWSFEENDFGKSRSAVLKKNGRWTTKSPDSQLRYACSKPGKNATGIREWMLSSSSGNFYAGQNPGANVCPAGYSFDHPATAQDNKRLLALMPAGETEVWLNYQTAPVPPVTATPNELHLYMDLSGMPPEPQTFQLAMQYDLELGPEVIQGGDWLQILSPQGALSMASGNTSLTVDLKSAAVQALPAGTYQAVVRLYGANVTPVDLRVSLHILAPTAVSLSTYLMPHGSGSPSPTEKIVRSDDTVLLQAKVGALCPDLGRDGAVAITGGVTFSDRFTDASGTVTTRKLGSLLINSNADKPSSPGAGDLTEMLNGCGSDTACGYLKLTPGTHQITAAYNRDNRYNSSSSSLVTLTVIDVALPLAPSALSFEAGKTKKAVSAQTITLKTSGPSFFLAKGLADWLLVRPAGGLFTGQTQVSVIIPDFASLTPGIYSSGVELTFGGKTWVVPVTLKVTDKLVAGSSSLAFSGPAALLGKVVNPESQFIDVRANSGGSMPFSVRTVLDGSPNWLSAKADLQNGRIVVSVDGAGLSRGRHYGEVAVSSPYAENGEQIIPVTVNMSIGSSYTIKSDPPGLTLLVDGQRYTTPYTFSWSTGNQKRTISVPPEYQLLRDGIRARFVRWSDGTAGNSRTITGPADVLFAPNVVDTTVTAEFERQYRLSVWANPGCSGSLNALSGWYAPSDQLVFRAVAADHFAFDHFTMMSEDGSSDTAPANGTLTIPRMNFSPRTVVGHFRRK